MLPRQAVPAPLARLALVQDGVLSRPQCRSAGLGEAVVRRLLAEGIWRKVAPGIYSSSNAEPGWDQLASAAVLLGGEGSRLAGRSAAWLHRLTDEPPLPVEVLCPTTVTDRPWVVYRRERPGWRRPSGAAWPPRLDVPDTVLDLCAVGGPAEVVQWVTTAVQRRRTTPLLLERRLAERDRIAHRRLIAEVVADARSGVHSNLEHRFLHDIQLAHGLPRGVRQYLVPGSGKRADVGFEEYGLLVELDGASWHSSSAARLRDRRRDNVHSGDALVTYRYGWEDVSGDACGVAVELAHGLTLRGWTGQLTRCPRCSAPVPDRGW